MLEASEVDDHYKLASPVRQALMLGLEVHVDITKLHLEPVQHTHCIRKKAIPDGTATASEIQRSAETLFRATCHGRCPGGTRRARRGPRVGRPNTYSLDPRHGPARAGRQAAHRLTADLSEGASG